MVNTLKQMNHKLHPFALGCVLLIPLAASLSRFAADLLLVLTVLAFLLHSAIERRTEWLQLRWLQIALLLWGYIMLRALFADEVANSLSRAATWLRFILFAAALQVWVLHSKAHFTRLLYGLSAAVAFMLLDTALQYFIGYDLLMRQPVAADIGMRLTGPYSSPRIGIMLIWMAIPCMAYWLMRCACASTHTPNHRRNLLLAAFYSVGTLTVIFMSGERMALLLTGLAFAMAFLLLPVCKKYMLVLAAIGGVLVGLLAYSNPSLIGRQMDSTQGVVAEFSGSLYGQIWQSAWQMAKQHPLTGVGLRQFRLHCPKASFGPTDAQSLEERCNLHPHNMYLEWLTEAGLIGLGLFVAMLSCIGALVLRAYGSLKTHPLFIGLIITLCIRLWPLASTTSFFTAWSAVPFWLMLGWLLAMTHRKQELSSSC